MRITGIKRIYSALPFLIILFLFSIGKAQQPDLAVEHITGETGLPDHRIKHIFQDSKGFIWISTANGIARFNGYDFKTYKHQPDNLNSLSDYTAYHIFEDAEHHFWIATRNGLNRFNPGTEEFRHYFHSENDSTTLSSDKIIMTAADAYGNIWVATRFGINRFNPENQTFKRFLTDDRTRNGVKSSYITDIFTDRQKKLWVGTEHGLNLFDYDRNTFVKYLPDTSNLTGLGRNRITNIFQKSSGELLIATFRGVLEVIPNQNGVTFIDYFEKLTGGNSYSKIPVKQIAEDQNGNLWFGTFVNGLLKYDFAREEMKHFYASSTVNPANNWNRVQSILVDANNNLWIGTLENSVFKYSELGQPLNLIEAVVPQGSTATTEITRLLIDAQKHLWVGTNNAGLRLFARNFLPKNKDTLTNLTPNLPAVLTEESSYISDILQDKNGEIWIGTMGRGVFRYNPKTGIVVTYRQNSAASHPLNDNFITALFEDSQESIWIGTAMKGIIKLDPQTNAFENFPSHPKYFNNPQYLSSPQVSAIAEDKTGNLWIGTGDGLNIFNRDTKLFTHIRHQHRRVESISSDDISAIHIDAKNKVWVGTLDGGLNLFNPLDSSFTKFSEKNILPDNTIFSILEDAQHNLLLKTQSGITRYNPESGDIKFFDHFKNRIQLSPYAFSDVFDTTTGDIYWGGDNKIFIMTPETFVDHQRNISPIVLTGFKIFNRDEKVRNANGDVLSITYADAFVLPHDKNVITFEFALLNFSDPAKNKYAYRLEGFDRDWVYSGNRREVTYTNLDPGTYVFRVRAADNKGKWSEKVLSVRLTINPPFWKTWWAYTLYILLFIGGLYLIRQNELNRLKLRHELQYKEFESQKLIEVDRLKSNFFANLSHEFRTPLTIILASLEQLQLKIDQPDALKEVEIMKNNAGRLLHLVNQLLELAKIDAGKVKLHAAEQNVTALLYRVVTAFNSLAERKSIRVTFNGLPLTAPNPQTDIPAFIDRKKMEVVFYNLLSNAIKFTPAEHHIDIQIEQVENFVKIVFENTGIEIPGDQLSRIFNRFYQVDASMQDQFEGTGIGLALVKEYVELHGGNVAVSSGANKTTFTIYLPLGTAHLKAHEISAADVEQGEIILPSATSAYHSVVDVPVSDEHERPIVLIIEDNTELRELLEEILRESYQVLVAENGVEGLRLAEEHLPDLILSDIMMPEMDGYELTKRLRANEKTDHIPVILLTARAATEDKLEGLSIGVDDYLIKPFHREELQLRIRNLIHSRQQMREKYLAQSLVTPGSVTVPSSQEQFIEKLKSLIDQHLTDDNFSVDVLCKKIGMSRTQLHRKIKSVTNLSTTEFVRSYRLQLAAELLKQDAGNIAEISQKVGFGSQAYFTKLFQELYGVTPLEYKKQHRQ